MRSLLDDIFIESYPSLDLHGETRDSTRFLVKDFLQDNYFLKNYKLLIIHGVGTGALKEEVLSILRQSKIVDTFHLNHYNSGCMVVYLKENKK